MTGKQRVLEILQQLASDQCDKVNIDKLAITEALDSIEEVFKDCLGEKESVGDMRPSSAYDPKQFRLLHRNGLRHEQLGRWESK